MHPRPQPLPKEDTRDRQLAGLGTLIQLERKARQATSLADLGFIIVNESSALLSYRQAALWRSGRASGRIVALSGVAAPETDAPYVAWLRNVCGYVASRDGGKELHAVSKADLPEQLAAHWGEWLPAYGFWVPLRRANGTILGGLLLAREQPWTDAEKRLLDNLAEAYGHAWGALAGSPAGAFDWLAERQLWIGISALVILAGVGMVPIRQSVLAPAEVIARDPALVRAPFDGVVDRFYIRPNESVTEGQPILSLDPRRLENGLEVAKKALDVASAEYRQSAQQAVLDAKSRANLAILKGRMEQHASEVRYYEDLLARIELKAPSNGVALFNDVNDWIGKPVAVGERILMVAAPTAPMIELHLPVEDAIAIPDGADVQVFLNIDPSHPVPARIEFQSYQAETRSDGVLAYRLKARIEDADRVLRIGLKGTGKVYGREVPLIEHVLRRPLSALRRWMAL